MYEHLILMLLLAGSTAGARRCYKGEVGESPPPPPVTIPSGDRVWPIRHPVGSVARRVSHSCPLSRG